MKTEMDTLEARKAELIALLTEAPEDPRHPAERLCDLCEDDFRVHKGAEQENEER